MQGDSVELLQALIRNACVNDGRPESGQEVRNADTLAAYLGSNGMEIQTYAAAPGRVSLVARIEGSQPGAPSLCLMGHTDVVPVSPDGWDRDPFGGELVNGEVWGRGAVDMLNLTSTMAVAFRELSRTGFRPRGDVIFFAVADEESGSTYGAQWMAEHHWDAIRAGYVLTEGGGVHAGTSEAPVVTVSVAEKGVSWRRLRVRGTPGHGSMPFRTNNALVKAAAVVTRLAEYAPGARLHEFWGSQVAALDIDEATKRTLLDAAAIDDILASLPDAGIARQLHACSHTTFSCNVMAGGAKTNVIPDQVDLEVDVRMLPGDDRAAIDRHLHEALGDLAHDVEIDTKFEHAPSTSPLNTQLWDSIERSVAKRFPSTRLAPVICLGFTDARVYRERGSIAYGAGLFDTSMASGDFSRRFHGHNERIDVESLRLTSEFWLDVVRDFDQQSP
jgi:acetylornithine deacetylase/succinyl-diaminopimelate desuccinylase-like protein